eukprot:PhF_6_TR1477/c0_g1_i1/m.2659
MEEPRAQLLRRQTFIVRPTPSMLTDPSARRARRNTLPTIHTYEMTYHSELLHEHTHTEHTLVSVGVPCLLLLLSFFGIGSIFIRALGVVQYGTRAVVPYCKVGRPDKKYYSELSSRMGYYRGILKLWNLPNMFYFYHGGMRAPKNIFTLVLTVVEHITAHVTLLARLGYAPTIDPQVASYVFSCAWWYLALWRFIVFVVSQVSSSSSFQWSLGFVLQVISMLCECYVANSFMVEPPKGGSSGGVVMTSTPKKLPRLSPSKLSRNNGDSSASSFSASSSSTPTLPWWKRRLGLWLWCRVVPSSDMSVVGTLGVLYNSINFLQIFF